MRRGFGQSVTRVAAEHAAVDQLTDGRLKHSIEYLIDSIAETLANH